MLSAAWGWWGVPSREDRAGTAPSCSAAEPPAMAACRVHPCPGDPRAEEGAPAAPHAQQQTEPLGSRGARASQDGGHGHGQAAGDPVQQPGLLWPLGGEVFSNVRKVPELSLQLGRGGGPATPPVAGTAA